MNATQTKTAPWYASYHLLLKKLLANYGTVHTMAGLNANLRMVEERLLELGFAIERISKEGQSDIVIAQRPPLSSGHWIGLYGHYDVEPIEEGWLTEPKDLVEKEDRLFGRGTGDNLGPLALRLIALENRDPAAPCPGMFWLLQGEEEIGSPFAHEKFPQIQTPSTVFWLDETGYFNEEGSQRFLVMNADQRLDGLISQLAEIAHQDGRETYQADRYLNKAFGQNRCPYLNHIVRDQPYLGIGPNDDFTGVHAPNESIPISTLALCMDQFNFILDQVAQWD